MSNQNKTESTGFLGCLMVVGAVLLFVGLITGILSGDMSKGIQGAAWIGTEILGAIVSIVAIVGFMWLISRK